jgi:ATP-binding cassette subfamily C protein LapB
MAGSAPEPQTAGGRNSFLESLVYITGYFGHARSAEALQAGLPVGKGGMTPKLFCAAADRAGFRARIVRRALSAIPPEVLPAVAVLKSKEAVVLVRPDGEGGGFRALDPLTRQERPLERDDYAGYAIYVKPDHEAEEGDGAPLSRHWFWGPVTDSSGIYARVMVASLLINCFALTGSIYIMNFYNRVLPNNAVETGWVLSIGAASVYAFDLIMRTLRGYFVDVAGRRADVILAQKLYDQVLDMRLGLKVGSSGAFANNMREFDALREFFNSATLTGIVDFPFSLLFIGVIWLIAGGKEAALLAFLYVVVAAAGWLMQLPVHRRVHQAMKTGEQKHGLLIETIMNIETIRGVGGEGALRDRYSHYVGRSAEAGQESRFWSGLSVNFSAFVQMFSGILVVLLGMYLIQDKEMSVGALMACVLLSSRAIAPVGAVAGLVNKYHQARSAYRTLDGIMRLPVERPRDKKFLHRPEIRGNFAFKDVAFAYPRTHQPVLEGVNINIRAGEKVAIVGRIGSGKSTLVKMMVDFYEPVKGTILVDDTDLRQIDPADLRRNIAYMGQDTSLMSGTIRENIVMGRPQATDTEVLKVAHLAGVHDFVRRHPMGYDAPVGERGEGLSGGQRQAVALARTLLMDTNVLILDEPTNAMDTGTENVVLKGLLEYTKGKTLVLVTHKLALVRLVERVIVMDAGKVVMDGSRDEVLKALTQGQVAAASS